MTKSTWLHLRIPFSFFLLPVFLFALCATPEISYNISHNISWYSAATLFIILHFLLYPASNGYNSYFDKDQQSIGILKNPPEVSLELYIVSLALDLMAIVWGFFIHWEVALMLLVYGLVSKAYSHPWIRLKKYPIIGWLIAGLFQGGFTFVMVVWGVQIAPGFWHWDQELIFGATLTTLLLWGSFPMTQVYQHQEDARRGDLTISRKLGIRGTFIFTLVVFLIADGGFIIYFLKYHTEALVWYFQLAMLPILGFFLYWFAIVNKDPARADYQHTMWLNFISAFSLNLFFGWWLWFSIDLFA